MLPSFVSHLLLICIHGYESTMSMANYNKMNERSLRRVLEGISSFVKRSIIIINGLQALLTLSMYGRLVNITKGDDYSQRWWWREICQWMEIREHFLTSIVRTLIDTSLMLHHLSTSLPMPFFLIHVTQWKP